MLHNCVRSRYGEILNRILIKALEILNQNHHFMALHARCVNREITTELNGKRKTFMLKTVENKFSYRVKIHLAL